MKRHVTAQPVNGYVSDYPQKPFSSQPLPLANEHYQVGQMIPESNSLGIAGFITSIIGILTCGILSIIGVVMSAIAMTKPPRGFATAGLIIGFVGLAEMAIIIVLVVGAVKTTKDVVNQAATRLQPKEAAQRIGVTVHDLG